MKLDATKGDYGQDFYWVGHPSCQSIGELERKMIERRYDIDIIGGIEDKDASYSYDDWALCKLDGEYYLLSTSGCSCPSPSETWDVQMGPTTIAEIRAQLKAGKYEGYTVPGKQMAEFMALLDKAEAADAAQLVN